MLINFVVFCSMISVKLDIFAYEGGLETTGGDR